MPSVYSISSEESDNDLDGIPPLNGAGDKGTCKDSGAKPKIKCKKLKDLMEYTDDLDKPTSSIEMEIEDDNNLIGVSAPVIEESPVHAMTNYLLKNANNFDKTYMNYLENRSLNPEELSDNNACMDEGENLLASDRSSSPDIEMRSTDNGVKRKGVGNSKGKGKKSSNTALERQTKKQKLAEEKAAKKTAAEMNKMYKPAECLKYMNIEGHPSVWARWYMSDVSREAGAVGARVVQAHALCNPALVVWTRTIPRTLDAEDGQVKLSPLREPCDRALYIAEAEELCEMVSSHTLSSHLSQIRQLCDCKLTLIVFNVKDYFKKKGRSTQNSVHSAPRRKTSNSNRTPMTEIDFELAITDLLVTADCDTIIANTANEIALIIIQLTKAIAEAPMKKAKRACDEKAAFYMRGDNKNCIGVDKDGVGVGRLWQQMLAILPQSSLETSRAICAKYKSPLALYESLQSSDSIANLADIGVARAAVAGSRARRVGPEFARKLHTLFTAADGDQLIE